MPYATKALLTTVYIVAVLTVMIVINRLPFFRNMTLINILVGGAPLLSVLVAYLLAQLKYKGH